MFLSVPFSVVFKASLRPPRRRGPSFCIDRKKAKSDQGCALDPDGQRRRSLKNGPFDAAQSAWTGVLRGTMIDVDLGNSMLGWAAASGVGWCLLPLSPDIARSLLKVGLIGCLRRIWIPCGGTAPLGHPFGNAAYGRPLCHLRMTSPLSVEVPPRKGAERWPAAAGRPPPPATAAPQAQRAGGAITPRRELPIAPQE